MRVQRSNKLTTILTAKVNTGHVDYVLHSSGRNRLVTARMVRHTVIAIAIITLNCNNNYDDDNNNNNKTNEITAYYKTKQALTTYSVLFYITLWWCPLFTVFF